MLLPHLDRAGTTAPVPIDSAGITGPTPGQARGPRWRAATPGGLHVPTGVDPTTLNQRIVEAVAAAPEGSALTGWGAFAWQSVPWFDGLARDGSTPLPVPVSLGDRGTAVRRPGYVLCNDWLFTDDIVWVDGLPVTCAERAVSFIARRAPTTLAAVQAIDMAFAADVTDPERLWNHLLRLAGRPGIRRAREASVAARQNVWSPQETRMRLLWHGTGRGRLLCNAPVFDLDGQHLFTPDLFDPVAGIAGEYEGAVHLQLTTRRRDLRREEAYRAHGIELVTMMSPDITDQRSFLGRLATAYERASARTGRRTWSLRQPPWWVDTSTVARRRALNELERRVWLRRRAV